MWEHMDSNQGPSACKADALNQLSYAPKNHLVTLNPPWRKLAPKNESAKIKRCVQFANFVHRNYIFF